MLEYDEKKKKMEIRNKDGNWGYNLQFDQKCEASCFYLLLVKWSTGLTDFQSYHSHILYYSGFV